MDSLVQEAGRPVPMGDNGALEATRVKLSERGGFESRDHPPQNSHIKADRLWGVAKIN